MKMYSINGVRFQKGFSMMEILVSVVIFSVGLAGMASMSLASLRSTADGQFNSQAMLIGEELADSMRANLSGYESNNYATLPELTDKVCSPDSKCTASEQAQYDSGKWRTHAVDELPGGIAHFCMDSTPNDGNPGAEACDGLGLNTIKIFWLDSRSDDSLDDGETYQRYVVTVIP